MKKRYPVTMLSLGYLYACLLILQNERVFFLDWRINVIIGIVLAGGSFAFVFAYKQEKPEGMAEEPIAAETIVQEPPAIIEPDAEPVIETGTAELEQAGEALKQIVKALEEVTVGSEHQSRSSAELAAAMQKFAENVMMVALKGEEAKQIAAKMDALTKEGASHMDDSVNHMDTITSKITFSYEKVRGLNGKTDQISALLKAIKDIAEQTNLLALNAAIEAARAGEQGRGFAVVADEVRKLSDQVRVAVTDITDVFQSIQTESKEAVEALGAGREAVAAGSDKITTTQSTFEQLSEEIGITSSQIEEIAAAMYDVLDNTRGVTDSINSIVAVAQQNAASMQEVTAITQDIQHKFDKK
ncbi:methyl-accepting chemotaxis protein [Terribacillus sp. 7520-G]|uniref:methyl-accepting chemotaxis protein n=1 Tax=Terribacillus sp. 7520-G TaxID=2025389 RepID=UPI0013044260|nr:methyl-accepting chemotaxis protein [Terribacillus sp. 7520-G]